MNFLFETSQTTQVLFVLNEKNIPCTLHEVDITNGEHCSDWFIHMNPKLDIPILQNGSLIVPYSNQIICYLDANFNGGELQSIFVVENNNYLFILYDKTRKIGENGLFPAENTKRLNEIVSIHGKISCLPIGLISLGTFIHSSIVRQPKLPFIAPLRSRFIRKHMPIFVDS